MTDSAGFNKNIATNVVEPVLDEMGFELVDMEYLSERGRWVLRIFADKSGGITLDECARISREVGNLIEIKDLIKNEYVLEVSSPGLNRPLKKEKDFLWALGKKVKLKMVHPIEGRRRFKGNLSKIRDGILYLDIDSHVFRLPLNDIEKANLVYEFEN